MGISIAFINLSEICISFYLDIDQVIFFQGWGGGVEKKQLNITDMFLSNKMVFS